MKDLINGYLVCQANDLNLQMILILPDTAKTGQQKELLLKTHGFNPSSFSIIGTGMAALKKLALQDYDTQEKIQLIKEPLQDAPLAELLLDDMSIRRHILILGHGKVGLIAQVQKKYFSSLLTSLSKKNCASLGVLSCRAAAQDNRSAYLTCTFPLFLFSAGDTISKVDPECQEFSLTRYFEGIQACISAGGLVKENIPLLKQSLSHIHCNIAHNRPWIFFPAQASFIHEATLLESMQETPDSNAPAAMDDDSKMLPPQDNPMMETDDETISITPILLSKIPAGASLEIQENKTLFLHVKTIPISIICINQIPQIFSMVPVNAHCFENMEFRQVNMALRLLLQALNEIKVPIFFKNLLCDASQTPFTDELDPESKIHLENIFIIPIQSGDIQINMFQVLFTFNNRFYLFQASYNTGYIREDFPQSKLQAAYSNLSKTLLEEKPKACKRPPSPEPQEESSPAIKRIRPEEDSL